MRKSGVVLCLEMTLICVLVAAGQEYKKAPGKTVVRAALNDDFAKAGLRALKAIAGETGSIEAMDGGEVGVPRETQELIDNSNAEAGTDKEKALVALFNKLYLFHLEITAKEQRDFYRWKQKKDSYQPTDMDAVERAYEEANSDPDVLKATAFTAELRKRESDCNAALTTILRSRTYANSPEACSDFSVASKP